MGDGCPQPPRTAAAATTAIAIAPAVRLGNRTIVTTLSTGRWRDSHDVLLLR